MTSIVEIRTVSPGTHGGSIWLAPVAVCIAIYLVDKTMVGVRYCNLTSTYFSSQSERQGAHRRYTVLLHLLS